ncbi:hypothetical protein MOV66_00140 [Agrobacterium sp. SHOUNA12C]|uniref:hypothetical protein n=1 Tax=Rhizobium rhizogenes TaxID=359 RepID=UPI0015727D5B|nr:hypothetical protein [Rhizobium rhizogenes]MCJ9720017.1 hypothetical protein [Agrobacterium sp. BETTINA12B]MCJ9755048.1 hypothetical protein [Agrobacterium sp. SHOUNA12C]NTF52761.1 hypothetical protein [Rhizobium rhizogenes]NTG18278.1 hypothetical protein [Rhizobium rhizogenes]NTG25110.1 hypothetical protein [Rhizobium rhizogenes]
MQPQRIIITSDLLRVTGEKASRKGFATNTNFFAAMLTPQISAATHLPVTVLEWDDTSPFDGKAVYDAFGLDANAANWARIFAADATDALCALFLPHVENSLVVGFEMAPLLQKILNRLDIPFVDIRWHPLRFLDDIFFGFSSNRSEVSAAIAPYALSGQEVDFHVGLHKATAIRRSAFNKKGPSYETLIVGQTPFDASLIDDGRIVTLLDHEDKIAELAKLGSIAFRPHPFSPHPSPPLAAFLEHHSIPRVDSNIDMYALLCDESLQRVVGLSSGTLDEAAYFGLPVTRFIPERFRYLPHVADAFQTDNEVLVYTGVYHAFLSVDFWADILQSTLERTWPNGNPIPFKPDRLRHVNGSYWGLLNTGGINLVMPYNTPE